ncbi:hypothetical protein TSAR_013668 [Trichomalopsis sarcophagae]|uniref:CCHC-type domain-containing protein n=1 Tax=Trichomalopsis sarcophagae TaxID=543379 RepID=A0A232EJF8_9HYME|nr:hypothetical protein TSAR_013668 [Trichomalopsis sarcophagae]
MEILQKLRESRKGEVSFMNKGERVHTFCDRFDQIITEHELSNDPEKLTEQEKRSTFYQVVIGVIPEIRRTDSAVITTTGKEMNMDDLRKVMVRIQEDNDANSKKPDSKEPTASRASFKNFRGDKNKCFRCNKTGHWQQDCPLTNLNRLFCYLCNCETDHKGDDYPINRLAEAEPTLEETEVKAEDSPEAIVEVLEAEQPPDELSMKMMVITGMSMTKTSKIKGVIKSANKNDFADIVIDGRGNLSLKNNISNENPIKLTNVIAAKVISENLLSLRRLIDAGFSINLDDKIFRVYNKENDKTIFEGIYEKPNWVVRFEVKKVTNKNNTMINESDNYSCIACLASVSEGDNSEYNTEASKEKESVIGREKSEEFIESNAENANSEETTTTECNACLMVIMENQPDILNSEVKQNEAMLWHIRLGHASLNYLKMLQKKEKILKHVKFDESIRDCEECILSKMEKLPFKQNKSRAERPLQIIHSDLMGPIKPTSWLGGKKYIMMFVDDYSRELSEHFMCDSGLPPSMWELAAEEAIHSYNITPHKSINYEVPTLKFSPKARCHLEQIRRFGCIAYIKLPKTETKFSSVSVKAILVMRQKHENISDMQIEFSENQSTKESQDAIECNFARYTKTSEIEEVNEDELGHILLASIQEDPISYKEGVNSEDKDLWIQAIKEELESTKKNEVWELVDRPKVQLNARLVTRGFKDRNIYDLKETYAPVSRLSLIRATISISNKEDLEICLRKKKCLWKYQK